MSPRARWERNPICRYRSEALLWGSFVVHLKGLTPSISPQVRAIKSSASVGCATMCGRRKLRMLGVIAKERWALSGKNRYSPNDGYIKVLGQ